MLEGAGVALAAIWGWAAAVAPLVWEALSSAFMAIRIGVFALLVCVAWVRIIEEQGTTNYHQTPAQRRRLRRSNALSRENLQRLDASNAAHGSPPPRRRPPASPSVSESDETESLAESFEDWPVWNQNDDDSSVVDGSEDASVAPATPSAKLASPKLVGAPKGPRPAPVSVASVPTPAHPPAAASGVDAHKSQQEKIADEVLPDEVAAMAEDEDEKQMLAGAAMAAGADLTQAGKDAVDTGLPGDKKRKGKKKKKPWLNRKIESFIKPYSNQYHAAGFMVYKGFNRMGKRVERGSVMLGKTAVREGERLLKKWVKFFGVVALLGVALLPLPNVHIAISTG